MLASPQGSAECAGADVEGSLAHSDSEPAAGLRPR